MEVALPYTLMAPSRFLRPIFLPRLYYYFSIRVATSNFDWSTNKLCCVAKTFLNLSFFISWELEYSVSNIEVCFLKLLKYIENKSFFVISWAYFQENIGHFDIQTNDILTHSYLQIMLKQRNCIKHESIDFDLKGNLKLPPSTTNQIVFRFSWFFKQKTKSRLSSGTAREPLK